MQVSILSVPFFAWHLEQRFFACTIVLTLFGNRLERLEKAGKVKIFPFPAILRNVQ
jgi:hypothetical protein